MNLEQLEEQYQAAYSIASNEAKYYKDKICFFRLISFLVRGFSFLLVATGTILAFAPVESPYSPTLLGFLEFQSPAHAGVVCITLAGLVIGLNRIFLISANWKRYLIAMMEIQLLIEIDKNSWAVLKDKLKDDILAEENTTTAMDLFAKLVKDTKDISIAETKVWSSDIDSAMKAISDLAKNASHDIQKQADKVEEDLKKEVAVGVVKVIIKNYTLLTGTISIKIDGTKAERALPSSTVVLQGISANGSPLPILFSGKYASDGKPCRIESAVNTKKNEITDVVIDIADSTSPNTTC